MATLLPTVKKEFDSLPAMSRSNVRKKTKKESALALRPKYPLLRPKPDPTVNPIEPRPSLPKRLPLLIKKPPNRHNPYSGCLISLCRTKACQLQTHHKWHPRDVSSRGRSIPLKPIDADDTTKMLRLADARLDALPALPIDILGGNEAKRLFHQFFAYDHPRLTALMLPPPTLSTTERSTSTIMQSVVEKSFSSPVFCIQYIASAHLHELSRNNQINPTKISGRLRGKLLQLLREELNDFQASDGEAVTLIILTVVQFDIALNHHVALDGHRNALQMLITNLGGFHRLKYAHHYVITLDRILAMYTGKPPLYAEKIDRSLLKTPTLDLCYGQGLELARDMLDLGLELFHFCSDICRAIEIVEHENWTFRPGRESGSFDSSQIQYLYFLKYNVHNTFAHLQSYSSASPKFMCVLLAANIVAYVVLQINYMPSITMFFLRRLMKVLKENDPPIDWSGHENILCWIMCVILATPVFRDGGQWTEACLFQLLCASYGFGDWPNDWIAQQARNVRLFVWSSMFDTQLIKALDRIELLRNFPAGQQNG